MNWSAHLSLAHSYWNQLLRPGDVAVDATCGNGYDTLFLAQLPLCALFALDIQPQAIAQTQTRLKQQLPKETLERVHCLQLSHTSWEQIAFPQPPRLIVYNLGYLPGGDKDCTTRKETTLVSVQGALELIALDGAISITCYPGHEEGGKRRRLYSRSVKLYLLNHGECAITDGSTEVLMPLRCSGSKGSKIPKQRLASAMR